MSRRERALSAMVFVVSLGACGEPGVREEVTLAPAVASAPARSSVATLLGTSGDVRVRRMGEVAWVPVSAGDPLYAGDAVQTMTGSRAVVTFAVSGVQSELEESTTLVIPAEPTEVARLTQLSGRLVARVEPGVGRERLEVVLPPGVLVLDTARIEGEPLRAIEARVDVTEERTDIAVTSGLAFLARENEPELRIGEGRFATIAADGGVASEGWSGPGITLIEPEDGATLRTRGRVRFHYATEAFISDPVVALSRSDGWRSELAGGRGEAAIDLPAGDYTWTVVGRRDEELARSGESRTLVVVLDVEPPALALSSPSEGATIASEVVTIRGSTEADARIEVDGVSVTVEPDGTFRTTRALPRGLNNLVIRARDSVGNSRVVSRSVVRR